LYQPGIIRFLHKERVGDRRGGEGEVKRRNKGVRREKIKDKQQRRF
jgi:hypothetical protein